MKKIMIAIMVAMFLAAPLCAFADNVNAGFNDGQKQGGFTGPQIPASGIVSVADALKMRDDAKVALEGNIIRYLGDEKYEFKDKTGSVVIDIDDDYNWGGQSVGPDDVVVIYGEIDRDFREFEIEVKRVEKK